MVRLASLTALLVLAPAGCGESLPEPTRFRLPPSGSGTETVLRIGDRFPSLNARDLGGTPIVFDENMLGERYTLIVFWSTWCGYCMQELPREIELSERYSEDGLRVIGVNADITMDIGRKAAADNGVPWVNLYEGRDRTISSQLGINAWPTLFLLDSKGVVVASSPYLRSQTVRVLPSGEQRVVHRLDWALEELLGRATQDGA